jgi:hypothetical protein
MLTVRQVSASVGAAVLAGETTYAARFALDAERRCVIAKIARNFLTR